MQKKTLKFLNSFLVLLKDAFIAWQDDKAWSTGAALAYFTVFSLAPLLLIVIAIASFIFGAEAAQGQVIDQIRELVGSKGAEMVQLMLQKAYLSDSTWLAAGIGLATLFFGASAVFVQLRDAINSMWRIREKPIGTIKGFIKARIISFTLILSIGFMLLVSLTFSALLAAFRDYLAGMLPGLGKIIGAADFFLSLCLATILFTLTFKILPSAIVHWSDLLVGSSVIALLFTIGKTAIGYYLGNSAVGSVFGAASALVVVMLWAFYSAQILLFGVEFTRVYADRFGHKIKPAKNALKVKIKHESRLNPF